MVERTLCPSQRFAEGNVQVHELWTVEAWERLRGGETPMPHILHWAGARVCVRRGGRECVCVCLTVSVRALVGNKIECE